MNKNQLLEYLKVVSELESTLYAHREAKARLLASKSKLGIHANIQREYVAMEQVDYKQKNIPEAMVTAMPIGLMVGVGAVGLLALGFIGSLLQFDCGSCYGFGGLGLVVAIPLILIPILAERSNNTDAQNEYDRKYNAAVNKYNTALSTAESNYQAAIASDLTRINKELQLVPIIDAHIKEIEENITTLEKRLIQLYNLNVIYPTYRNHVAIAQIYDYIASGMCPALEGGDGAYAQYMNDVRAEKICTSIKALENTIAQGFSAVIAMQNTLCNQLNECIGLLHGIDSSLSSISEHTANIQQYTYDALQYQREVSGYLSRIAGGVDRVALNSRISELNRMSERVQNNANTIFMSYPQ